MADEKIYMTAEELTVAMQDASYREVTVIEVVRTLFRGANMQEFVEEPTDREYTMIMNKAITELNQINPITTDRKYAEWVASQDPFQLLCRMTMCGVIELVLQDYAHKGIESHNIEDIAVGDRTSRYDSLLTMCNKDQLREDVRGYKKSKNLGVDIEEGLAMGTVRCARMNDFDSIHIR